MPKSCVVGGATEALRKVSAFKPSRRTLLNKENGPTMWDNGDQTGLDPLTTQWSAVCTSPKTALSHLLFSEEMGMPPKKRPLMSRAIPTLFPKAAEVQSEAMAWAYPSIHYEAVKATGSGSSSRSAAIDKRKVHALSGMTHAPSDTTSFSSTFEISLHQTHSQGVGIIGTSCKNTYIY